jgi:hypothetical protein
MHLGVDERLVRARVMRRSRDNTWVPGCTGLAVICATVSHPRKPRNSCLSEPAGPASCPASLSVSRSSILTALWYFQNELF